MSREGENKINIHRRMWFGLNIATLSAHKHKHKYTHTSCALVIWIANKKQRERNRGQSATTRLCRRKKNERTTSIQCVFFFGGEWGKQREDSDNNLLLLHLFSDSRPCAFVDGFFFSSLFLSCRSPFFHVAAPLIILTHSHTLVPHWQCLVCSLSSAHTYRFAAITRPTAIWLPMRTRKKKLRHTRLLCDDKESKYAFECGCACVRNHLNYLIIML